MEIMRRKSLSGSKEKRRKGNETNEKEKESDCKSFAVIVKGSAKRNTSRNFNLFLS